MRCFFAFIFTILLFQNIPVFAEKGLAVKVGLTSPAQRTAVPKSLLTSVFSIVNSGLEEDKYLLRASVPDRWQVISSLAPISLSPKETRLIPLTVFIPTTALATLTYQLSLVVASQTDPQIKEQAIVTVGVLPHARVRVISPSIGVKASPGQSITYAFRIINLGNSKDRFEITASSAHGEKIDLSKKTLELGVGEQGEITATIHIPLDVSPGTRHCLILKASSVLLEKKIFDQVIVYTPIRGVKPRKEEGLHKTLPSELTFHLSGMGTGRSLGPQVEFNTGGQIDERHRINFAYQGPYSKQRENYRGLSEDKITLDFGRDFWDISLGDTSASISELTTLSLNEWGARFRIQKGPISGLFFDMERTQAGFKENLTGGRLIGEIGSNTELGVNFLLADEDKTDPNADREPEKKKIFSLSALQRLKDLFIQAEYAGSRFDQGNSEEKEDKAWWISSKFKKQWLYLSTEYICAGSDFPGSRKDNKGYRAYLSYRFLKPLWLWVHKNKFHNNLKGDPGKSTEYTQGLEVGASLSTEILPFFSFSYQVNNARSEQQTLLTDSEEKSILFRSDKSFGPISLSFDAKWGRTQDNIALVKSKVSEYTARLYACWEKLSGWIGYGYNIEKNIILHAKSILKRKELGLQYQPSSKISTSISFSQEGTMDQKDSELFSLNINYIPWADTFFSLEGEMRNDHQEFNHNWQFWLTFTTRFDFPVPLLKIRGALEGIVFIDENNNGLVDKAERGISKIKLLLDENQAITNKKGGFKFPSVIPGEYEFDIDISSLPVGLVSHIPLPLRIDLPIGKPVEVNIPLVRACKVRGAVFDDKNKNGKRDGGEEGLSLIRVLLIRDSSILKDTFSDVNGKYSFAGILSGKYNVSIEEDWLPKRYILTTPATYSIDLAPAEEILNLNFGSMEKERRIIKTFAAPSVEAIYPEKKERPLLLRRIRKIIKDWSK